MKRMNDGLLEDWRKQIDKLDEKILHLLAKRMDIVKEIGRHKKLHGIDPFDERRWRKILQSKLSKARSSNLPVDFIEKLYSLIHEYSLKIEKTVKIENE